MPNLIPQDIREWMRRVEFKLNDLMRRPSSLVPGDIADGVDLDDYRSTGRWTRRSGTGTTTALGYPLDGSAGVLEVYNDPEILSVHQIFYDRVNNTVWMRYNSLGVSWSAWSPVGGDGLPGSAFAQNAAQQTIVAAAQAVLPTSVTATMDLPAGTHHVHASVSALFGSGTAFTPDSSASVRYHLSGALSFTPGMTASGIAGVDEPLGSGGGTLSLVHTVTTAVPANLTITAMGVLHAGTGVVVRDVRVMLAAIRRL